MPQVRLTVSNLQGHAVALSFSGAYRRHFGIPIGGPFEPQVALRAQSLFEIHSPVFGIEVAYGTLGLTAVSAVNAAVVIGPALARLNGESIATENPVQLSAGDQLSVTVSRGYARAWLFFGGQSNLRLSQTLALHDEVGFEPTIIPPFGEIIAPWWHSAEPEIRFVPRLDYGLDLGAFWAEASHLQSREGIRFQISLNLSRKEFPSRPIPTGTLQFTPDGTLIVTGPDGPSIGGYPSGGTVIPTDFRRLAQIIPGTSAQFLPLSLDEAQSIERDSECEMAKLRTQLKIARTLARQSNS